MKLTDIVKKTKTIVRNLKETVAEASREPIFEERIDERTRIAEPSAEKKVVVQVSGEGVAKATLIILGLLLLAYGVTKIADILVVFFVAFLLAAAMEPTIDALNKRKIPRGVAVIGFYIIVIAFLIFVISYMVPILAQQISELAINLGVYLKSLAEGQTTLPIPPRFQPYVNEFLASVNIHDLAGQIESGMKLVAGQLFTIGGNILEIITVISHGLISMVLILVLAYFMVVEKHSVDSFIFAFFPVKHEHYIASKIVLIQKKIGFWLRGMLIMMLSMAVLVFIGLTALGIKYAAVLAIIAGLLELVPVVGPLVAWLLALPIVVNQSALGFFSVTILYGVVQQFESHVLVPIVMKRIVGLNPIVILFALLVGYQFLGVLGAILSVPVATLFSIFLDGFFSRSRSKPA
jgi:predicted PurR-regulated permease PerM